MKIRDSLCLHLLFSIIIDQLRMPGAFRAKFIIYHLQLKNWELLMHDSMAKCLILYLQLTIWKFLMPLKLNLWITSQTWIRELWQNFALILNIFSEISIKIKYKTYPTIWRKILCIIIDIETLEKLTLENLWR